MQVEVVKAKLGDAHIIENFWALYTHEMSEYTDSLPNPHGLFDDDPSVRSFAGNLFIRDWLMQPEVYFPYLIKVDNRPAGFGIVATPAAANEHPHLPPNVDFMVWEFFVLIPYRGKGVAQSAAHQLFNLHRGGWDAVALIKNTKAQSFWRRAISEYTGGHFEEETGATMFGEGVSFRFNNQAKCGQVPTTPPG